MDLFAETIRDQFEDLHQQGVRIRFVGRRDRVSEALLTQMTGIEDAHRGQPPARPVGRLRLRRAGRDRRGLPRDRARRHRARGRSTPTCCARTSRRRSCPIRTSSSGRRASTASRTSCSGSRPTPNTCSRPCCGRTSAPTPCATRSPSTRVAVVASGGADAGPARTGSSSRCRWRRWRSPPSTRAAGSWWCSRPWRGVISVHELFAMARAMRPMALAGQAGDDDRDRRRPLGGRRVGRGGRPDHAAAGVHPGRGGRDEGVGDGVDRGHAAGAVLDRRRPRVARAAARPDAERLRPQHPVRRAARHLGVGHLRLLRRAPVRPPAPGAGDLAEEDRRGLPDRLRVRRASPSGGRCTRSRTT